MRFRFLVFAACAWAAGHAAAASGWRDGDIIFHTSRSAQSAAIQRATHSPYSHVGVVFFRDGNPYVFEAIATVRYTPLANWIARGDGGRYVVRRLKQAPTAAQVARLRSAARAFEGKPYDLYFEWSDERIYCSELVWKLYDQALGVKLGELQELREFDLTVLASVLAVVGYSINDKVVVFDRVRELFRSTRKAEPYEVLNRAINQTLSRTIMTSLTTALSMFALYFFGGPAVHGFALTMLIGIVIGTLSSIFFANPILYWLGVSKKDLMPVSKENPELARRP